MILRHEPARSWGLEVVHPREILYGICYTHGSFWYIMVDSSSIFWSCAPGTHSLCLLLGTSPPSGSVGVSEHKRHGRCRRQPQIA